MQSRRIAPPLDLRAEIQSDDLPGDKAPTSSRPPSLQLNPAPAPKGLPKKLVLKRIYKQFPETWRRFKSWSSRVGVLQYSSIFQYSLIKPDHSLIPWYRILACMSSRGKLPTVASACRSTIYSHLPSAITKTVPRLV